jgi:hypothetical protein
MNWHDNFIESITFPSENLILSIQLSYILEWIKPSDQEFYKFKIALARLDFYNVLNLTYLFRFWKYFLYIYRWNNRKLTPDQKSYKWDYKIQTDQGTMTFYASGFMQALISNPKISDSHRFLDC